MRAFHSTAAPQFSHVAQKTYAAPVWSNSARAEIKFSPLAATRKESRRRAREIWDHAKSFERRTATTRVDAYGRRHHQGKLGRMGLAVLNAFLFKFINHSSGRLDPSYDAIASEAIISRRSVARALERLKAAGILNWVRRCSEAMDGDRYVLTQETNAYGIAAPSCWKGYRPPPEPPPPDPASWGATPPLPAFGVASGDGKGRMVTALEGAGSPLTDALARLGRRLS